KKVEGATRPYCANIRLNVLACALLGFLLGVGLVFVRECFDSSLNTPEHVWRAVALNTFGVIPDFNSLSRRFLNYDNHSYDNRSLGKFLPKSLLPSRRGSATASKELIVLHHPLSVVAGSL